MLQPEPDPQDPRRDPSEETPDLWVDAELPTQEERPPGLLDDPTITDALGRLKLLDEARNLRERGEADAKLALAAGQAGDTAQMMAYLRRSFQMVLAANRTIDQAGDGFAGPDGFPHEARQVGDFHYYYQAGPLQAVAQCRLRIWEHHGQAPVVVATELADNPGMSITNAAGELATDVWGLLGFPERGLTWIEHYPGRGRERHQQENFAQVSFTWTGSSFIRPEWRFMTREAVEALIGGPLEEDRTQ